jgi:sortase A
MSTDATQTPPPGDPQLPIPASHRARRRAGGVLAIAGAALLLWVGVTYLRGALARDAARSRWEELQASAEARRAYETVAASGADARTIPRGAPVARLRIASIGLDEVVVEGVDVRSLNAGPGHLPGSVLPGAVGNSVLSAHRDRHFSRLGRLAIGDTVVTETLDGGPPSRWVVRRRTVVARGAPALYHTATPTLTLTTCWPLGYLGGAPDRLLVTALPVGAPAAAVSAR